MIPSIGTGTGGITPNAYMFTEWRIYSKSQLSDVYGSWIAGPSGWGPSRLSWSDRIGVSNSYTGTLKVSKSAVDASVGFSISTSYTKTATYSVEPPSNQEWTIMYRKRYDKWKVTQRTYRHEGSTHYWTSDYAYVYPKKFDNFSYDYNVTDTR
ncbi:hypothetical protein ACTQ5K_16095 [Niallia sp. Sow4_A1]|uniref:hypothetical protein n=1 Tax=Niallia sp. Sow4_A1 TaxID=3438793 RepID=UPI003F96FD61